MPPDHIDRYQILAEIGHGGMAIVYRAYDTQHKTQVAIKILPREFIHERQFRERFQREIKVLSTFRHPAIVSIYGYGQYQGQLYLIMPYMGGGSLEDRIKRKGTYSLPEIITLMERIAPALEAAHQQGIIHRDLKPSNILFDEHDQPFIADFGLAHMVEQAGTTNLTGSLILGTPAYMSPEQARGGVELDGRSDVYSLGVVLFELLSGKLPFNADSPMQLALKHLIEPVPDILTVNPMLPARCRKVITKALAKKPEERYATPQELALAVRDLLQKPATPALQTPVGKSPPGRAPLSRVPSFHHLDRKVLWGGVGLLLLGLIIGLGILWRGSSIAKTPEMAPVSGQSPLVLPSSTPALPRTITPAATAVISMIAFTQAGINLSAGDQPFAIGETLSARRKPLELWVYPVNGFEPPGYVYAFPGSLLSVSKLDEQEFQIQVEEGSRVFIETGKFPKAELLPSIQGELVFVGESSSACLALDFTLGGQLWASCYQGECSLQIQDHRSIGLALGEQAGVDLQSMAVVSIVPIPIEEAQAFAAVLPVGSTAYNCAHRLILTPISTPTTKPRTAVTDRPTKTPKRGSIDTPQPPQPTKPSQPTQPPTNPPTPKPTSPPTVYPIP